MIRHAGNPKPGYIFIVVFWAGVLCLVDYPAPFIDDLSYIGTSLNLVQHGTYSNPYCEMLTMVRSGPGQLFLDYMPVENYVLAGWMAMFGIGFLPLHILFTALALVSSVFIYRSLPKGRFSFLAAIMICLAVFGLLGGTGLRADALGLCLYLAGCEVRQARTTLAYFAWSLVLGLVVITFPNLGLLAMLTSTAVLLYRVLVEKLTLVQAAPLVLVTGAAYLLCFLVFLAAIHGRLGDFLFSTMKNQELSAMGVRERFQFLTPLGLAKWVAAQGLFIVLAARHLARGWQDPGRRGDRFFIFFCLAAFVLLGYASANSATGAHVWAFGCMMVSLYLLSQEQARWPSWGVLALVFGIVAFGHFHVAIQHIIANRPPDKAERGKLLAELDRIHPAHLEIDVYAARELYDYHLPEGSFAFETSRKAAWGLPRSASELQAGTVSVVSVTVAFPTPGSPNAGNALRPLRLLGHVVPGVAENPYDLVIMDNR